jgi:DNA-binding response OmpR family regulator
VEILLADDDPTMRLLLTRVVEKSGHTVVKAAVDGQDAWDAFASHPVPMVILDWEMPGINGLELCRRIRDASFGETTFVLMVTARGTTEDLAAVLDAGADDYLSKPVTPENVRARLRIAEKRIEVSAARRAAEEELRKARYLAGIGETSLALQHEINNPLAALLSHASLIDAKMVDGTDLDESLATIVEQARRIADVVKKLRQLDNPRSVEYLGQTRMIDINPGHTNKP